MDKSLQFIIGCVILYLSGSPLYGQTVILSENFSGFTTGSHSTPSNSDASATLDSKTQIPGWSCLKVYPAGGEIKVGIENTPGWIETPPTDMSQNEGNFIVKFDICRWPNDATTVQVNLNGTAIGPVLTPTDDFQSVQITGTGGTITGRIRIQGISKRFFLDNFSILSGNVQTSLLSAENNEIKIMIYPNPVKNRLTISNIQNINQIDIFDITGKLLQSYLCHMEKEIQIGVENLNKGIYFIRLNYSEKYIVMRFVKL